MSDLMVRDQYAMVVQRMEESLTQSRAKMQLHRSAAIYAMEELGRIHAGVTLEAARALATAEIIRRGRAGSITPSEEAAYNHYDQVFLSQAAVLMQQAGGQVIEQARHVRLPDPPAPPTPRGFLDELLGR